MGWSKRWSSESVSPSAAPFEHSRPKLAGCAGSPEIVASPCRSTAARMPQPTPQYGQVVRTAGGCGDKVFIDRLTALVDLPPFPVRLSCFVARTPAALARLPAPLML